LADGLLVGVTGNAVDGTTGARYARSGSQGIESSRASETSRGSGHSFRRSAIAKAAANFQASAIHELCYQTGSIGNWPGGRFLAKFALRTGGERDCHWNRQTGGQLGGKTCLRRDTGFQGRASRNGSR
jgi:hypothetical protein